MTRKMFYVNVVKSFQQPAAVLLPRHTQNVKCWTW